MMMKNTNSTLSMAIMSGKGGVGKTNIALNLGYALRAEGMGAMLMDCDLGLANLDVLLGISPDHNLQDLLRNELSPNDVLVEVEDGLSILPATSGVPELVEMDEDMRDILFRKLLTLASQFDYVLLDLGAGISQTVRSFASSTQLRLVIVTPEPTSMTDCYALIKVLVSQHGVKDFLVVVNQAHSEREATETFDRLHAACKNFLDIELRNLGRIRHDPKVVESVIRQEPFIKFAPNAPASLDVKALAKRLMKYRSTNMERIEGRPILKNM